MGVVVAVLNSWQMKDRTMLLESCSCLKAVCENGLRFPTFVGIVVLSLGRLVEMS